MKYTAAWAEIASKNATLKAAVACLALSTVALSLTAVKLALRTPLIIERGDRADVVARADGNRVIPASEKREHSPDEIVAFVKEALAIRFNSGTEPIPGFLSDEELALREQEQHDLSSRAMTQTVIIRSVKPSADGGSVTVDADRLISVGPVRSAFPFPLTVTIASTDRTAWNSYGLVLQKVTAQTNGASK